MRSHRLAAQIFRSLMLTGLFAAFAAGVVGFLFHEHGRGGRPRFFFMPALLLLVLFVGSRWAARRIARRLESLSADVARFGAGNLEARASVEGDDEIGRLARAFNDSAARIAALFKAQRTMLQNASHELRSPLSRLRLAVEMLAAEELTPEARAKLVADAEQDTAELDLLIEDLLLAGKLADDKVPRRFTELDLAALVSHEARRLGLSTALPSLSYVGDRRMLQSLIRNLLENAKRYGAEPIDVRLTEGPAGVELAVLDSGEGVPAEDRERIFEPFFRRAGQSEGRGGGAGLGLSLVRSIAAHHGGEVRYAPLDGRPCFAVRLPREPARPAM